MYIVCPLPHVFLSLQSRQDGIARSGGKRREQGMQCTDEEAKWLANFYPHTMKHSACPNSEKWHTALLESAEQQRTATIVSLGCNKGDDFVSAMRKWARNSTYSTARLQGYKGNTSQKRVCPAGYSDADTPVNEHRVRPVRGLCVEPMISTYEFLARAFSGMGIDGDVTRVHAAASSTSGSARFPNAVEGTEHLGLDTKGAESYFDVAVTTVDKLVEDHNITYIDMLSIDTEGFDAEVLKGAAKTLGAQKVRYLEFEHHSVGSWAKTSLKSVIEALDTAGFDCYWALGRKKEPNGPGGLSRLTRCWDRRYNQKQWSNVACIHRSDAHAREAMQVRRLLRLVVRRVLLVLLLLAVLRLLLSLLLLVLLLLLLLLLLPLLLRLRLLLPTPL